MGEKIEGNKVKARGQSKEIRDLLGILEAHSIPYNITPPYPHKIPDLSSIFQNE